MRVIVGCEFSQVVTRAFRDKGHEAYSCDLLPTEGNPAWHFQEDILELLKRERFDLAIFHPPCTHLAVSGARWFKEKRDKQEAALSFVEALLYAPIEHIALENPVSIISSRIRKPDQTNSAVDVRTWRNESNVPVAKKPAETVTDKYS